MAKPSKLTRKQHWVPQFYLRHFADSNECLWAHRRNSDKIFSTKVNGICYERDLHEIRFSESDKPTDFYMPNYIENRLSKIESCLARSYSKLLNDCDSFHLTPDDQLALCFFIAHLLVRHPNLIKQEQERISPFFTSRQIESEVTSAELKALEQSGWREDGNALVKLAVENVLLLSDNERAPLFRLYEQFANKRVCIYKARAGANFISTSALYFIIGPEDDSYEFDFAYMPLSSRYAALFTSNDSIPVFNRLNLSEVDQLNQLLLLNSPIWETAFAQAKWPLEKVLSAHSKIEKPTSHSDK